jgi:GTP-binding protein LepA
MQKYIRNFSIIAHIDHGKSTLADRIISKCGAISDRQMSAQVMDTLDIEKERGITIKAQSVRLKYTKNNIEYTLNLIDTPGHVDFSYEVSRSLASSEGALVIIDSAQGVEAQTIANVYIAIENNLELIPVINKIDLPSADPDRVIKEVESIIGLDCSNASLVSAKAGIGIDELLDSIVDLIPPPDGDEDMPTKAIIYDSWFDSYLGALMLVRVYDGEIKKNQNIYIMGSKSSHIVNELMYPHPISREKTDIIKTGEIGIVSLGIKSVDRVRVGDTVTDFKNKTKLAIDGFEPAKSFVFAGIYPVETDKFEDLREALDKLTLNDSSISYEPESSVALGNGFRTGFLGLLHMDVTRQRLEREFNIALITTAPTVIYNILKTDGTVLQIQNPNDIPPLNKISKILEPYVIATVITPTEFLGNVIKLLNDKRGVQRKMDYINETRVLLEYNLPMNEIVMDFYDKLKSTTKGYASFDYEIGDFQEGKLQKMDILVSGEPVDALSVIVSEDKVRTKGKDLVAKMKDMIPRQLFEVSIQASIGTKIIARETVKALRKNVTAKCYGGDITRKRKLLEKQKRGKKRMKSIGRVEIPSEAFMAILKID